MIVLFVCCEVLDGSFVVVVYLFVCFLSLISFFHNYFIYLFDILIDVAVFVIRDRFIKEKKEREKKADLC